MKWLADECVDQQIIDRLESDGHEVVSVARLDPGITDSEVLEFAVRENLVILTSDKDFGEMVFRQRRVPTGVVLTRLSGLPQDEKAELVSRVATRHESSIPGSFVVVTPTGVRIRRLDL
jgi:predicted nuclease of predicted toxin-antitoxin system